MLKTLVKCHCELCTRQNCVEGTSRSNHGNFVKIKSYYNDAFAKFLSCEQRVQFGNKKEGIVFLSFIIVCLLHRSQGGRLNRRLFSYIHHDRYSDTAEVCAILIK